RRRRNPNSKRTGFIITSKTGRTFAKTLPRPRYCSKWHPPPDATLKCNIDMASFDTNVVPVWGWSF
ncbi:hypothetical protein LINGRAHAP2_LOCUS29927, partial [Linum grandiflorum]